MIDPGQSPSGRAGSIQFKLVVAFLLVSLLPMLFAADVATRVVSRLFERNVETWLRETSIYFLNNILETQQEAVGVGQFVTAQPDLVRALLADPDRHELPAYLQQLIRAVGYDLVAVYDGEKQLKFSWPAVDAIEQVPLTSDNSLYRVRLHDRTVITAAGVRQFQVDGVPYFLVLGTWLDEGFLTAMENVTSLELRLYYRENGKFVEAFSSRRGADPNLVLPQDVSDALLDGTASFYDSNAEAGQYRGMYSPLRNTDGSIVAVIFCGLRSRETLSGWLNQTNLFLSIFLTGTLLSVLAGYLVSRRLSRPLRSLAKGVRAVAAGDYSQKVEVQGRDEVAELATAFNQMSVRLAQLHDLEAQLRRRDRLSALGEVAVGIAHEVRNPLGIIKTSAELVQKKSVLAPADARLLGYVIDEVRRIDILIKEFLAFAKPAPPVLGLVRPIDVVTRVTRFCEPELERHNVTLRLLNELPNAAVNGDDDQLYQACLNLILNAIDAMPDGGTLTIRLCRSEGDVRIAFTDTGHGISADLQERIFNPFFTTKEQGSGLGLAKVFAVMESHGGRVECRSAPGAGATFTLVLPLIIREPVDVAHHLAG